MSKIANFFKSLTMCVFFIIMLKFLIPFLPSIPYTQNHLVLSDITRDYDSSFISDLKDMARRQRILGKDYIHININSNGGYVMIGHNIVTYIEHLKYQGFTINCYVEKAISMGFTILQYCSNRVAGERAILMQHMIHNGKGRENMEFDSIEDEVSINYLARLHGEDEAERLGISFKQYLKRYQYSKWYKPKDACKDNVIDFIYKNNKLVPCSEILEEEDAKISK